MRTLLNRLLLDPWAEIQRESAAERIRTADRFDPRPAMALVLCAVSLTLNEYVGSHGVFRSLFARFSGWHYFELASFAWWTGIRVVGYALVPGIILIMQGQRLNEHGVSAKGVTTHLWTYVALLLAILPLVVIASRTEPFLATYPFYTDASRSPFDLAVWEALYAVQFVALEFFFRGYLLFSLRPVMGVYSIFVTVVPYCLIHWPKPLPEVLGAIVAGTVLGTLALRTRSIWPGVAMHVAVAWTMDALALWTKGGFRP